MQVDIWANYIVGGGPTTEFMGAFVGHDGIRAERWPVFSIQAMVAPAVTIVSTKTTGEQFIESGQYSPPYGDLPPDVRIPREQRVRTRSWQAPFRF